MFPLQRDAVIELDKILVLPRGGGLLLQRIRVVFLRLPTRGKTRGLYREWVSKDGVRYAIIVFQAKRIRKLSDALDSISSKRSQGTVKDMTSRPKGLRR